MLHATLSNRIHDKALPVKRCRAAGKLLAQCLNLIIPCIVSAELHVDINANNGIHTMRGADISSENKRAHECVIRSAVLLWQGNIFLRLCYTTVGQKHVQ